MSIMYIIKYDKKKLFYLMHYSFWITWLQEQIIHWNRVMLEIGTNGTDKLSNHTDGRD